jgi:hypothetical protein
VWVDVDDDGVSFNTAWPRAKPRHLDADPRVSLVVVDPNDPYRWIAVTGTTTLIDEGANAQIDRLSRSTPGARSTRRTGRARHGSRSASRPPGSSPAGSDPPGLTPPRQAARTECTGGSFVAAVNQVFPASRDPNTSPDVAPK